ncbi:hypothetical protein HMPREF3034_02233 [Prevotella sp. DNF00663]|uniref:hypothetical protein n=1 Tax=unclassified Prevotella TaxID=2638335 RepID=UPI00051421D3|nr:MULTISPECIES: hypothetical protein [unclassified Prevotella]KGI60773.1 hypothetical protein HMPREF0671_04355 [Prevotella sp. S7 MS 2]KXB79063.1 hypothetical protein HMPREF3034_02233 [Prevotella sp. DNF00663]
MKQLSRLQSVLFMVGGALMVIGAGCFVFMFQQQIFCWVFLLGAVLFAVMQMMQTYEGKSFIVRRLKKMLTLADILFILAGMLMLNDVYGIFRPLFSNILDYVNYMYNKWVVMLLVAALLEMYAMHRISSELKKEEGGSR